MCFDEPVRTNNSHLATAHRVDPVALPTPPSPSRSSPRHTRIGARAHTMAEDGDPDIFDEEEPQARERRERRVRARARTPHSLVVELRTGTRCGGMRGMAADVCFEDRCGCAQLHPFAFVCPLRALWRPCERRVTRAACWLMTRERAQPR